VKRRPTVAGLLARAALLVASCALALPLTATTAGASPVVTGVKSSTSATRTRVVLDLDGPVSFKWGQLRADPSLGRPSRVWVDLYGITNGGGIETALVSNDTRVLRMRASQNRTDKARIVFDLRAPVRPTVFTLPPDGDRPDRLVVDLLDGAVVIREKAVTSPPLAVTAIAEDPATARQVRQRAAVVADMEAMLEQASTSATPAAPGKQLPAATTIEAAPSRATPTPAPATKKKISPIDLDFSTLGYLQESVAPSLDDPDELLFHRQTLHMELEGYTGGGHMLRLAADVYRDDASFQDESTVKSRLREAYLRLRFDKVDLRLGRQQIAWGEADGAIVSDQVSPFDLTNFIVPEFDEIRLGVDGVTLDYYFDDGSDLQLLWLGRFTSPDFPDLGSPWSFVDPDALGGLALLPAERPAASFANSEFGLRYSRHPLAADWSIGYLRSWDDRPSLAVDPLSGTATPRHEQFDLLTFNVVHPRGNLLYRLDAAFENNRMFSVSPLAAPETAGRGFRARQDVARVLLALDTKPDFDWWEQADASLQLVHEQIIDPHSALLHPRETDYVGLRLSGAWMAETIKPWLFTMVNVRGNDAWLQAKVDYQPMDNWKFSAEYDAFFGHAYNPMARTGGTFGRFDRNDMLLFTVRRSF